MVRPVSAHSIGRKSRSRPVAGRSSQCITRSGSEKRTAYAEEQIEIYLAAMEQQDGTDIDIKEKLEAYQQ